MAATPYKLFSKDYSGNHVNPLLAMATPSRSFMFNKNENTIKLQGQVFKAIQIASDICNRRETRGLNDQIDISILRHDAAFQELFSLGNDDVFTMKDLTVALTRMGLSFMSRCPDIQERANAYIIQMIGAVEQTLDGCVSSNDIAELYEDAQLVLLLTPPDHKEKEKERGKEKEKEKERERERQREKEKEKERGKEREKEREKDFKCSDRTSKVKSPRSSLQSSGKQSYAAYTDIEKVNPPPLFVCHKAHPTRNLNLTDSDELCFRLSARSLKAIMTFLPNLFNDSSVLNPEQVQGPSGGRGRGRVVHTYVHLKEFWDYFDTDGDNMVTRHDVRRGLSIMAENFIANDIVCQNITNTYVQINLKKARDALQRTYVTSEITYRHGKAKSLLPGTLATYTDSSKSLRRVRIVEYLGDDVYRVSLGTRSSIIDIEGYRLNAVPNPSNAALNSPDRDALCRARNGLTNGSSKGYDETRRSGAESDSRSTLSHSEDFEEDDYICVGRNNSIDNHDNNNDKNNINSEDNSTTRNEYYDKVGQEELLEILRGALGPSFRLTPELMPGPEKHQDYHLKFGADRTFWFKQADYGVHFADFLGLEYVPDPECVLSCPSAMETFRCMFIHLGVGVGVHPFALQVHFRKAAENILSKGGEKEGEIEGRRKGGKEVGKEIEGSASVGVGVSTYASATPSSKSSSSSTVTSSASTDTHVRTNASTFENPNGEGKNGESENGNGKAEEKDGSLVKDLFSEQLLSVVTKDSYCEMDVLNVVWPQDLEGYRVMLVSFQEIGSKGFYKFKSIVTYTPETGPFDNNKEWIGKDVILTLKDGHFTLITPNLSDPRNSFPWGEYPIDDLVASIRNYNNEFGVNSVCLQEYPIGPYIQKTEREENTEIAIVRAEPSFSNLFGFL